MSLFKLTFIHHYFYAISTNSTQWKGHPVLVYKNSLPLRTPKNDFVDPLQGLHIKNCRIGEPLQSARSVCGSEGMDVQQREA